MGRNVRRRKECKVVQRLDKRWAPGDARHLPGQTNDPLAAGCIRFRAHAIAFFRSVRHMEHPVQPGMTRLTPP